ncbi:MAG: hypothetical protein J7L11_02015 [Thermoprotei archaeon]|nr:hypothetical protein [Thermoprotei archaeon]
MLILSPRYELFRRLRGRVKRLLLSLLELKLLLKGYSLLHAACIERDHKANLIIAPPETGKTFTIIRLIKDHGFNFMSDDIVIVGPGGLLYCFPTPMTVHTYHLKKLNLKLPISLGLKMRLRWFFKGLPLIGRTIGEFKLPFEEVIGKEKLVLKSRVHRIYLLMKGSKALKEADAEEALKRLLVVGRMHRNIFEDPIVRYAYMHPTIDLDGLFKAQRDIYEELIARAECFMISSRDRMYYAEAIAELSS